jgi:uncharacterized membrane protein YhhN
MAPKPGLPTRSNSIEVWLLWVAAAVALAYLLLQRPYAGDVALKTSMCVLLAIAAFRGKMKLFALALLFSAAGDAFLAYDGERLFGPGLASFLVTHVLYAVVFVLATKDTATTPMSAGRKVTFAVVPTFAVAYSVLLWPNLGALAIPVLLYIAAIVAMAMLIVSVGEADKTPGRRQRLRISDCGLRIWRNRSTRDRRPETGDRRVRTRRP